MIYPRMNKDEYPTIPDVIQSEEDYKLLLEYVVFSAIKIEELQKKAKNPFMKDDEKQRHQRLIELSLTKYDRMCALIDDYKEKEREEFERRLKRLQMPVSKM